MKKYIYKNIRTLMLVASLGAVMTSCSTDEIIDLKLFNSIDENLAFSTTGNVDQLLWKCIMLLKMVSTTLQVMLKINHKMR